MKTFSNILLRLLAVILCLALIVVTLPQVLFSKAGEVFGLNEPESRVTEDNEMTAFVLGEMADERTARTKTFRMSDGGFLLANYAEPVHFVDVGGKWMDYDNTLKYIETESSSGYENTASDVLMRFSVYPEGSELVSLQSREYAVRMSLLNALSEAKATVTNPHASPEGNDIDSATTLPNYSSGLVYENIAKGADLQVKKRKYQAPLPPGGPHWDDILKKTLKEIKELARKGVKGYKEIYKLLNDSRFNK